MPELFKRIVSGIVLVILITACILLNKVSFFLFFFAVQLIGLHEFYRIAEKCGVKPYIFSGIASASLFFLCSALNSSGTTGPLIYFVFIPSLYLIYASALTDKLVNPIGNLAYTVLGIFYTAIPLSALNYLAFSQSKQYSFQTLMGYMLLIWIYDSFAYVSGNLLGRNKLNERISPYKTWEGLVTGAIICILFSILISRFEATNSYFHWGIIAVIIIITGTTGDLFKSLLKRNAGVKDSGKLIPGHGGVLDRFDSILFSAPFVAMYKMLFMV